MTFSQLYRLLRESEQNEDPYLLSSCLFRMLRIGVTRQKLIELALIESSAKEIKRR